jgi:acetyl-CoA synthetase
MHSLFSLGKIKRLAAEASRDPRGFWAERAGYLDWFARPHSIIEGDPPEVYWFKGGLLNIAYNAVDSTLGLGVTRWPSTTRMRGVTLGR